MMYLILFNKQLLFENRALRQALLKFYFIYYIFMIGMTYALYLFTMKAWFLIMISLCLVP